MDGPQEQPRELHQVRQQVMKTVGSLQVPRSHHCSARLSTGKILFIGGAVDSSGGVTATTEVYDPVTRATSLRAPMNVARRDSQCLTLQDGSILALGGLDGDSLVSDVAEKYSPSTDTWTLLSPIPFRTYGMSGVQLDDGRVLMTGGNNYSASTYLYDPSTNAWTSTGSLNVGRIYTVALKLPDGRVLAVGGWGANKNLRQLEVYTPSTGTWSTLAPLLKDASVPAAALLPDGRVFVGQMDDYGKITPQVYDVSTNTWSLLPPANATHGGGVKMGLINGQPILVGGDGDMPMSIERFDASTQQWTTLGQVTYWYDFTLDVLTDGSVLLAGGNKGNSQSYPGLDLITFDSPAGTTPFGYTVSNTNSAQQNTLSRFFALNAGDKLEVGTCGVPGSAAAGDTFLRVLGNGILLALNDDSCGGMASYIQYTATTTGIHELRAGCYSSSGCSGTVTFRITPAPMPQLSYSATNTSSAQQNTTNRVFTLNAGDKLEVGTCNLLGASASGDTYLRVFGNGTQVAFNDDSCGGTASYIQYTAATTGTYELRAGCYSGGACSGTATFRITPARP